jgi:hypothetical protein
LNREWLFGLALIELIKLSHSTFRMRAATARDKNCNCGA